MVSASILIAVFAAVALAGLYVAIRIHLAGGTRRKRKAGVAREASNISESRVSPHHCRPNQGAAQQERVALQTASSESARPVPANPTSRHR